VILAFGDEMEDTEWRSVWDALSTALGGALRVVPALMCQV
jgi:hypothetical protein